MTTERVCQREGCAADISALRADALYCSESCGKAARRAGSPDKGRTRRKSRDGHGVYVYLTADELICLAVLEGAPEDIAQPLVSKLGRALGRAGAQEVAH